MKKLTIEDFEIVQPYIQNANYKGYNSNFVTLMMWNHEYHILYEIIDDILIMLLEFDNHQFFSMPFCKKDDIVKAIQWMKDYAKQENIEFRVECVIKEVRDVIQNAFFDEFSYVQHLGYSDYIYDLHALVSLKGKKMQKRRNHYNYFINNYVDYHFKVIETGDLNAVYHCLNRWVSLHGDDTMVDSELIGIKYLLDNLDKLPIKTGCIYVNGILEAFTIGSVLPHSTIQIHVEKANRDIRGLYVAINKMFLEYHYSDYLYVNREEDMGIESLKKAKQALHPIEMVDKYRIFYNQYEIEECSDKYKVQLIDLWKNNFEDEDDQSTEYYFKHHYPKNDCFIMTYHNQLISCVSIHQYAIKEGIVNYIVGVATKQEHQHNHCMKKLLQYVMNHDKFKKYPFYLMTDKPEVYQSLGFHESYFKFKYIINTFDDLICYLDNHIGSSREMLSLYNNVMTSHSGYKLRDEAYFDLFSKRAKAYNQHILCYYENTQLVGYILYEESENIVIHEIMCLDTDVFHQIIQSFKVRNKEIVVYSNVKIDKYTSYSEVCVMYSNHIGLVYENPLFISEIM